MHCRFRVIPAFLPTVPVAAGCSSSPPSDTKPIERAQEPITYTRDMPPIAEPDWTTRGQIVESTNETVFDMSKLPEGTSVTKMVYRSTSGISGAPTVVTYAHFTSGVSAGCGPTDDKELRGSISFVGGVLDRGIAVAYTDYVGLGDIGSQLKQVHPYLEPKSAAFNVIEDGGHGLNPDEPMNNWIAARFAGLPAPSNC